MMLTAHTPTGNQYLKTIAGPAPIGPRAIKTISTGATRNMKKTTQNIQRRDFILSSTAQASMENNQTLFYCLGIVLKSQRQRSISYQSAAFFHIYSNFLRIPCATFIPETRFNAPSGFFMPDTKKRRLLM
jgi:hypothetical protein